MKITTKRKDKNSTAKIYIKNREKKLSEKLKEASIKHKDIN